MERGASWSQQLDDNFAERTSVFWMSQVYWPSDPSFTVWYANFKVYSSTVGTTVISHVTLVTVW